MEVRRVGVNWERKRHALPQDMAIRQESGIPYPTTDKANAIFFFLHGGGIQDVIIHARHASLLPLPRC